MRLWPGLSLRDHRFAELVNLSLTNLTPYVLASTFWRARVLACLLFVWLVGWFVGRWSLVYLRVAWSFVGGAVRLASACIAQLSADKAWAG